MFIYSKVHSSLSGPPACPAWVLVWLNHAASALAAAAASPRTASPPAPPLPTHQTQQDLETTVRPAVAFLASLGLAPAQLRMMCLRFPRVVQYTVGHISALASFLASLGFGRPEVCSVLAKFPAIGALALCG